MRTFEAAARRGSFARAAEELNVTPAAVSFQVRELEAELGDALFVRGHRSVELTDRGKRLARDLEPAFSAIDRAWAASTAPAPASQFLVSAPEDVVRRWLMPAVKRAGAASPDIRVVWDVSLTKRDLTKGEADAAIRYGVDPAPDLHCEPLHHSWFTPLVRPELARHIKRPSDLVKLGLINVEVGIDEIGGETAWGPWFRAMGEAPPTEFAMSCRFSRNAVEMARTTGHVAIGGIPISGGVVEPGDLVAPFNVAVRSRSRYWLLCRKGAENTPEMTWFRGCVMDGMDEVLKSAEGLKIIDLDGNEVDGLR